MPRRAIRSKSKWTCASTGNAAPPTGGGRGGKAPAPTKREQGKHSLGGGVRRRQGGPRCASIVVLQCCSKLLCSDRARVRFLKMMSSSHRFVVAVSIIYMTPLLGAIRASLSRFKFVKRMLTKRIYIFATTKLSMRPKELEKKL